jgi:hypothetical protein
MIWAEAGWIEHKADVSKRQARALRMLDILKKGSLSGAE